MTPQEIENLIFAAIILLKYLQSAQISKTDVQQIWILQTYFEYLTFRLFSVLFEWLFNTQEMKIYFWSLESPWFFLFFFLFFIHSFISFLILPLLSFPPPPSTPFPLRESLQDRRYGNELYPSRHRTITCRVVRREAWETLGFSDVTWLAGPACPRTRSTLPTSNRKCERGRQHPSEAGFRSRGTSADRHDNLCRGTHAEEQRPTEKPLRQNLSASWQKVSNGNTSRLFREFLIRF